MGGIALIACDHGFGHVRRCLMISRELARKGQKVTLFAPASTVDRFSFLRAAGVDVIDFSTQTTRSALREGRRDTVNWHHRLPDLDDYCLVVCDNLPEILEIRADAVLSGSFLWHQVLSHLDEGMARRARELIAHHHPLMIASRLFASAQLIETTPVECVGVCVTDPRPGSCGRDLLIASGGNDILDQDYRSAVADLATSASVPPFPIVWVEEKLMPKAPPPWMQRAVFGLDLYRKLGACICRPGVGTLSDSLWAGARVFCVHEKGNTEMVLNTHRVAEAGVGEGFATVSDAVVAAMAYARNSIAKAQHRQHSGQIDFDGVSQISDVLLKMMD